MAGGTGAGVLLFLKGYGAALAGGSSPCRTREGMIASGGDLRRRGSTKGKLASSMDGFVRALRLGGGNYDGCCADQQDP
jgi:hypothetical protein